VLVEPTGAIPPGGCYVVSDDPARVYQHAARLQSCWTDCNTLPPTNSLDCPMSTQVSAPVTDERWLPFRKVGAPGHSLHRRALPQGESPHSHALTRTLAPPTNERPVVPSCSAHERVRPAPAGLPLAPGGERGRVAPVQLCPAHCANAHPAWWPGLTKPHEQSTKAPASSSPTKALVPPRP
jgi:hypothetical protein